MNRNLVNKAVEKISSLGKSPQNSLILLEKDFKEYMDLSLKLLVIKKKYIEIIEKYVEDRSSSPVGINLNMFPGIQSNTVSNDEMLDDNNALELLIEQLKDIIPEVASKRDFIQKSLKSFTSSFIEILSNIDATNSYLDSVIEESGMIYGSSEMNSLIQQI